MKGTAQERTELVSPPPAGAVWGETSSLIVGNPPAAGTILPKPSTPLHPSETEQDHSKGIAEGFLSEVSTPEIASKNGQEDIPCAENENGYQTVSKPSPNNSFSAAHNELKVKNESKPDGISFSVSKCKFYLDSGKGEGSQRPFHSPNERTSEQSLKDETENNRSIKSHVRRDSEQDANANLKRKSLSRDEGKVERKRVKTGGSERSRGKGSAQWSHLSEEELKKLRRVKNRESVEKCRTKQRLRMEALQVEQTCLRLENKNLREAMGLVHAALHDVSVQVTEIKTEMESNSEEETLDKMNEMRKEVQA